MTVVVQDWTNYRASLLFSNSDEYFKSRGKDAFSDKGKKNKYVVPNAITNCYPHAHSIVRLLKANLANYPSDHKLKVLEAGSGSGIFARYLLQALQEEGILDRVELILSDYSLANIEAIRDSDILEEFKSQVDIKFLELDLLNINATKDLDANAYKLEDISLAIFNYIFCVLPLTVLRWDPKLKALLELELKFNNNSRRYEFLQDLSIDHRWGKYTDPGASELKYLSLLERHIQLHPGSGSYFYPYNTLAIIDEITDLLDDNGFIFMGDMPILSSAKTPYTIYGSSIAHPINDGIVQQLCNLKNLNTVRYLDDYYSLFRMMIYKNESSKEVLEKVFNDEYVEKNDANLCLILRDYLHRIKSKHSHQVIKYLLDELSKIDQHSSYYHYAKAKYHKAIGEDDKALDALQHAARSDFLGNLGIENMELNEVEII